MRQAAKAKDFLKMHNADYKFHQIIWKKSANP
jgi:DNA-binding GntR family transcriptional regulator